MMDNTIYLETLKAADINDNTEALIEVCQLHELEYKKFGGEIFADMFGDGAFYKVIAVQNSNKSFIDFYADMNEFRCKKKSKLTEFVKFIVLEWDFPWKALEKWGCYYFSDGENFWLPKDEVMNFESFLEFHSLCDWRQVAA